MRDGERAEQAGAEREARDASVHRTSRGPVARAVEAALTKYLAVERYREQPGKPPTDKEPRAPDADPHAPPDRQA